MRKILSIGTPRSVDKQVDNLGITAPAMRKLPKFTYGGLTMGFVDIDYCV